MLASFNTPLRLSLCLLSFCLSAYVASAQTDTLSVYFDIDEDTDFNANVLDERSEILPTLNGIIIIGYADHLGSKEYNEALSMRRAESVARYLMSQGVNKRKISVVKGEGELPLKQDDGGHGVLTDRRVDVIIPSFEKTAVKKPISPPPSKPEPQPQPQQETFEIDSNKKENIVLEGLTFIPGRHFPTPESMPVLDRLVSTMQKYPSLKIEIQGHICCEYEEFDGMDLDSRTMNLSENRAKYVYKYLIQNGIYERRMTYVGKGSSDPKVFPERSEADQQANRRVELKIVEF